MTQHIWRKNDFPALHWKVEKHIPRNVWFYRSEYSKLPNPLPED